VPLVVKKPLLQKTAFPVLLLTIVGSLLPSAMQSAERNVQRKIIRTNAYTLAARYSANRVDVEETGGGISPFGGKYLLATGDGRLFTFERGAGTEELELRQLPHRVPFNRGDFLRDTADSPISGRIFRTAHILVIDEGDRFRLFAAHHYWRSDERCTTVRVSTTAGSYAEFLQATTPAAWKTLFEAKPCFPFDEEGSYFAGHEMGGAMQQLDARTLLLTLGDQDHDGVHMKDPVAQQPNASYGKTLLIDIETGAASTFTTGHRNQQGLYIDPSGNIWSSEHGPKGGDELNLLVRGRNYGWPLVTYGTNYDASAWPLNPRQGRHEGFEAPLFAWVPSVGISSITSVRKNRLDRWKGDLLVASLGGMSIWRVRIDRGRVVTTERIEIGDRVRDLIEDEEGRLILWTEKTHPGPTTAGLVVIEPLDGQPAPQGLVAGESDPQRGELLFDRCAGCHSADGSNRHGIGPHLDGIVGRRIASVDGYSFSHALKGLSGAWTSDTLDAFIADPQALAPGTAMQAESITDPKDRAALIQYLKTR
jgi:cytochrome c2